MHRRSRRGAVAFASIAGVALVACQLLVGVRDEEGVVRPSGAPVDASSDAAIDSHDPCLKKRPPPPPPPQPPSDAPEPRLDFAVRTFLVRPRDRTLGYDLDERCTGTSESTTNESPCRFPGKPVPDDEGGADNSFGAVVDTYNLLGSGGSNDPASDGLNLELGRGARTFLIVLREYNGTKNDEAVKVGFVSSEQLLSVGCDAGSPLDSGVDGGPTPLWDSCDTWGSVPGDVFGMNDPTVLWDGYVSDGVLVAPFKTFKLALGGVTLVIHDGTFSASFGKTSDGIRQLSAGTLAGRVLANDLVRVAGYFGNAQRPICQDSVIYGVLRDSICAGRDIPISKSDDGKRDRACDALSVAFGVEAVAARLGAVGRPAVQATTCDAMACTE